GRWVVCDRFTDATYAYQSGGSGVPWECIAALEKWIQGDFQPDASILLDVPADVGHARSRQARVPDRFEQEELAFHQRVRSAYLRRAREHPNRIHVIDAQGDVPTVRTRLEEVIIRTCF